MPRPNEIKELLRCRFTPDQLAEKSRELAGSIQRQITAKEEKVAVMADFKERIDREGALVGKLSRDINNGWEMREVDVDIYYNSPNIGMKEFVRRDTSELVKTETMTQTELQSTLPFERLQEHLAATAQATKDAANKQWAHEVRVTKFEDGHAKAQCMTCDWSEGGVNKAGEIEAAGRAHSEAHGYLAVVDPVDESIADSEAAAKKFFGIGENGEVVDATEQGEAESLDPTEPEPADDERLDPDDDGDQERVDAIMNKESMVIPGSEEPERPEGVRTYEEVHAEAQTEKLVICGVPHPGTDPKDPANLCRLDYQHLDPTHATNDGRTWTDGEEEPHTPAAPAKPRGGTKRKK